MANKPSLFAFTVQYGQIVRHLRFEATVIGAFSPVKPSAPVPGALDVHAIMDTGAERTAIAEHIAATLNMPRFGTTTVDHAGGSSEHDVFMIDVSLPNGIVIRGIKAVSCPLKGCDALIGMDIISRGDLAISNYGAQTAMSFRYPSADITNYEAP